MCPYLGCDCTDEQKTLPGARGLHGSARKPISTAGPADCLLAPERLADMLEARKSPRGSSQPVTSVKEPDSFLLSSFHRTPHQCRIAGPQVAPY